MKKPRKQGNAKKPIDYSPARPLTPEELEDLRADAKATHEYCQKRWAKDRGKALRVKKRPADSGGRENQQPLPE
jgi:hypothetical protein